MNFEPMRSLADDDEDYENGFNILNEISPDIAGQYLLLLWMDTVCYNMDRHTENFGLLRDVKTGRIISLAPNYDNNIALIAKGYPTDVRREHDGLIGFLRTFIQSSEEAHEMYRQMKPPEITERMIDECMDEFRSRQIGIISAALYLTVRKRCVKLSVRILNPTKTIQSE